MTKELKGKILTILGAVSWGLSGVCGQYLMQVSQMSPIYLTALRMMIAGSVLTAMAYVQNQRIFRQFLKEPREIIRLLIFSIFGLLLCQLTYLYAINHSNAGTATVLQYTCPIIIVIYVSIRQKTIPTKMEILAIILALAGTFIIATHGNPTALSLTPEGLFWGIISAFAYALYTLLPGTLIHRWGSLFVCGVGLLVGGVVFYIASASWQYIIVWHPYTLLSLIGIIGIGTILAYTLFLEGIATIGPVMGSLLAAAEPIASVIFSVILLGEIFQLIDVIGIFAILLAVYIITIKDQIKQKRMQVNKEK